ncbi:MAG: toxin-antitoxin system YwqK family antitoxin [Bacteroidales bacterium]|jgi:antitoxin component YwqK of YwqJK toxin-antitoxin module|nr:toxin-antitoxin system YwqK family antitoxin [Bacteroidales bacterium]MDD3151625.1 toxin-antitoxin system YwqK family antitoxin [Bacteroidales bacterium]
MKKFLLSLFLTLFLCQLIECQTHNTKMLCDTVFFETGKIKIIRTHNADLSVMYCKLFGENGRTLIAEGKYFEKKRDSIWTFYDNSGVLKSRETYLNDLKNGESSMYYANGKISGVYEWKNGNKDGLWKEYYSSGNLKAAGFYTNDKLAGGYKLFHPNRQLCVEGYYADDVRDGVWKYYDETGNLISEEKYVKGKKVE